MATRTTQNPRQTVLLRALGLLCVVSLFLPSIGDSAPLPRSQPRLNVPSQPSNHSGRKRLAQVKIRKRVVLEVKLVYAHTKPKKEIDPRLTKELPSLQKIYDFNAFRLLQTMKHTLSYRQALIVRISSRYQMQLSPQEYNKKTKKIAIQATFLHRNKPKNAKRARFAAYATTNIRLQDGGKVAFLGSAYEYGRVLIILSVQGQ